MTLVDGLDLGAAIVPTAPCLETDSATLSYAEAQGLSRSIAASLTACGLGAGETVGVMSASDPLVLTVLFGASRAGAAWTVVDPTTATIVDLMRQVDACSALFHRAADSELARELGMRLPQLRLTVCLDARAGGAGEGALGWGEFLMAGVNLDAER